MDITDLKNIILFLLENVCVVTMLATLLTSFRRLRRMIRWHNATFSEKLLLGTLFGILSVYGTYTGLSFRGAIVNTRVITTLTAGLVAGPAAGITAGLISGLHRYLYNPQGFTSLACGIGTFTFGLIGAIFHQYYEKKPQNSTLLILVVLSEGIQALMILMLCKPFEDALALEKAILLPKIVVNSLGVIIFMTMLTRLNRNLTQEIANQRVAALTIAMECSPYLKQGLQNQAAMTKVTELIRNSLPHFAVILTDTGKICGASGCSWNTDGLPQPCLRAIALKKIQIDAQYQGDQYLILKKNGVAIAIPFYNGSNAIGTLLLIAEVGPNTILDADISTAYALAQFCSSSLQEAEITHQMELRQQAEFRALQSQINPHFLYNALNTISALCMVDAQKAREMIHVLSDYFRQTLTINESFVSLAKEMDNVNNYLYLSQVRFEDALHVTVQLPDDLEKLKLPPLILQPLVENAVRHGGPTSTNRILSLTITQDDEFAYISVRDHGHGFDEKVLADLNDPNNTRYSGLFNVRKRLNSIYGELCKFKVESSPEGSTVQLRLPLNPPGYQPVFAQK